MLFSIFHSTYTFLFLSWSLGLTAPEAMRDAKEAITRRQMNNSNVNKQNKNQTRCKTVQK